MSSTINLHDKLTNDLRTYPYEEGWTIRDLRESIADEEGYDSAKPIKIFNAIFELNDDELVQDFAGEEEENFIEFNTFSTITSNKDILIWRPSIIGSSWFPLKKGKEVTLNLGEKRHLMNKGMAKFAIVSSIK